MSKLTALAAVMLVTSIAACSSSNAPEPSVAPGGGTADGATDPPEQTGDGGAGPATDAGSQGDDAAGGGTGKALPLGKISASVAGSGGKPCPPGATCTELTVTCTGLADAQAIVAVRQPSGTAKGTVYVHGGGGGDQFYNTNADEIVSAGFRTAQVRWSSDWETTAKDGIKAAACRPATVLKWVFDNVQNGDRKTGYCAMGHSGGSSVLAYSLAHYGGGSLLDYASLLAGPPFGRIDYGCAPSTYSGPATNLCAELPNAPYALPTDKMDAWENTSSCGAATPVPADVAKWAADSVVSPGATYDYPKTLVDFLDCAVNPNGTTGGAFFYSQKIGSSHSVSCPTDCSGEALGTIGTAKQLQLMIAGCVARH